MILPWYADEKARLGAFSSLLGVHVWTHSAQMEQGGWSATAVGDSCVFHARDGRILAAFPIDASDNFDNHPFLIPSRCSITREDTQVAMYAGTWQSGDRFYLMTDAAAQWFLKDEENDLAPHDRVERAFCIEQENFDEWAHTLRAARRLRNDDVTILRLLIT